MRDLVDTPQHFHVFERPVSELEILGPHGHFLHIARDRRLIRKKIDDIDGQVCARLGIEPVQHGAERRVVE